MQADATINIRGSNSTRPDDPLPKMLLSKRVNVNGTLNNYPLRMVHMSVVDCKSWSNTSKSQSF